MNQILLALFIIGGVLLILEAILKFAAIALLSIIGAAIAAALVALIYVIFRSIYHALNPTAKQKYIESKEQKKRRDQELAEKIAIAEVERAASLAKADLKTTSDIANAKIEAEFHRDANEQFKPYSYQIATHANEALAIRYGIANQEQPVYRFLTQYDSEKSSRNRRTSTVEPANRIRLQKLCKIRQNIYDVQLTDYNNRRARAVIEPGTEYVKTFLPLDDLWFSHYADLEMTLKGNGSFSLKELATFHIQKTI